ncbi:protein translocase subunit SecF [bacterium]|nr:protein translocase subunit SecF [bacterium]
MELIKSTNFDFVGKRRIAYIFSLIVILTGLIFFGIKGKDNFGVDFVGGDMMDIEFSKSCSATDVREVIRTLNIGTYSVQVLGTDGKSFIIKSGPNTHETILEALREKYGEEGFAVKSSSLVSPSMSTTLRKKALYAFIAGMLGILLYLTIRFEFRFAVGATVAIFHDMLFVVAVLALTKKQIDATAIAALLTIAGYSVNDTVVIYDRVRENIRKYRDNDYVAVFNRSINETLSRTVLTVLTTLFVVVCLFFFGGETLHIFSFALLIGFVIGTYSSIFIATSLLIDWHRLKPHKFNV